MVDYINICIESAVTPQLLQMSAGPFQTNWAASPRKSGNVIPLVRAPMIMQMVLWLVTHWQQLMEMSAWLSELSHLSTHRSSVHSSHTVTTFYTVRNKLSTVFDQRFLANSAGIYHHSVINGTQGYNSAVWCAGCCKAGVFEAWHSMSAELSRVMVTMT